MAVPRYNALSSVAFWLRDCTRYIRYAIRLVTRPSSVKLHGIRMQIPPDCCDKHRRAILSEKHERRMACAVLAKLEPHDVVVEFGGGLGFISALCAKRLSSDRVSTFEANPHAIEPIREIYALNKVEPNLVSGAIGATDSEITFWVHDYTVTSSTAGGTEGHRPVKVQQYGINGQLEKLKPTFVIMDIEGTEADIFRVANLDGIEKILLEIHPKMLGKEATDTLMQTILDNGFQQSRFLSTSRKKYFERPRRPVRS